MSEQMKERPKLAELVENIRTTKWHALGLQLGVEENVLVTISTQCNDSIEDCRRQMFNSWLNTQPSASRTQLVNALRKDSVAENYMAERYERLFQKNKLDYTTTPQFEHSGPQKSVLIAGLIVPVDECKAFERILHLYNDDFKSENKQIESLSKDICQIKEQLQQLPLSLFQPNCEESGLMLPDSKRNLTQEREMWKTSFAECMIRLDQVEAEVKSVKRKSEDVQTEVHLLVVKNARDNIDRERAVDKKLSDLEQQNSFQELEMNKLIEAKKQNEKKIEALETAASSHEKKIDKLRQSGIKNSQVNLKYETLNTQLKDSLQELTEKVDRELNSLSEDIKVLYQEIQTLKSHVLYKTTSHTVKMTDFTKYSQTPDSLTRRHNFPVIRTLHEETPLKLEPPSSQGVVELPRLSNLPSTYTSVSTTITPRQRPQSVKVHTFETRPETPLKLTSSSSQGMFELPPLSSLPPRLTSTSVSTTITPTQRPQSVKVHTFETRPEIMSHPTSAQDRKNRLTSRNSCPSMTSSHKNK